MTKITILNGGKEFEYITKMSIEYIIDELRDNEFTPIVTTNCDVLILNNKQFMILKEVK